MVAEGPVPEAELTTGSWGGQGGVLKSCGTAEVELGIWRSSWSCRMWRSGGSENWQAGSAAGTGVRRFVVFADGQSEGADAPLLPFRRRDLVPDLGAGRHLPAYPSSQEHQRPEEVVGRPRPAYPTSHVTSSQGEGRPMPAYPSSRTSSSRIGEQGGICQPTTSSQRPKSFVNIPEKRGRSTSEESESTTRSSGSSADPSSRSTSRSASTNRCVSVSDDGDKKIKKEPQPSDNWITERYKLRETMFKDLLGRLRPGPIDLDAFADSEMHLLPRWWGEGGEHEDAFGQWWGHSAGVLWMNPPYSPETMERVVEKIISDGARVVMAVPHWPGQRWLHVLMGYAVRRTYYRRGRYMFEKTGPTRWGVWGLMVDGSRWLGRYKVPHAEDVPKDHTRSKVRRERRKFRKVPIA